MIKGTFRIIILLLLTATTAICQEAVLNQDLSLKYLVQQPAGKMEHVPVIILLHGRGGNEAEFFALRQSLPKNYMVVSARAPYQIGEGSYHWFEITKTGDDFKAKQDQMDSSRIIVTKFIGEIIHKYKADPKQVYLIGFSQGAWMCYQVGLTAPDKIKGIGVLSGLLYESLKPLIKITPELKQMKIFIGHGTLDERIKFTQARSADEYLKSMGLKPEFHEYAGMPHQISNEELQDLANWLNK